MEFKMESKIEVLMTPHYHDNPDKPYFWSIVTDGVNSGFGWAKTPEKAWKKAFDYYKDHYIN